MKANQPTKTRTWFIERFGTKNLIKQLAKLFFPAILEVIIVTSLNYFDSLFLALFTPENQGTIAKTATVLTSQLMFMPEIIIFAIASAGSILAAQYYGKKDYQRFKECINFMMLFSMIASLTFMSIYLSVPTQMINLFAGDNLPDTNDIAGLKAYEMTNLLASNFLFFLSLTLIPLAFVLVIANALRQDRAVVVPLISSIVSVLFNIILDPILIKFHASTALEAVRNVAYVTIGARFLDMLILLITIAVRKNKPYHIFNHPKLSKTVFKEIFKHGWQIIVNEIAYSVGITVIIMFYLRYNAVHRDAISTVALLVQITGLVWPGAAVVVSVFVIAELGANKQELAKKNTKIILNWSIVVGIVLGIIIFIISLFINPILNPPTDINNKLSVEHAKNIALTAQHLEWILMMTVMLQSPMAVMYFCIRGGGSRFILLINTLPIIIWLIIIGCLTNINVPEDPNERINVVVVFFIIELNNLLILVISIILLLKTKWANNIVGVNKEVNDIENKTNTEVNEVQNGQ
ncbi:MATE family efflux transporter [Ureaplasma canigenitalium]|uniref:MATE family efflux transporter n=1 Tax=Ureaplasma canigenitalium TaxID=42092 RepID=UPI0004E15EA6|nr:MATE family efflux transporter [Ureaplasma canigenitalium]